jgi:ABC-2 type transport system ATP-binding protein
MGPSEHAPIVSLRSLKKVYSTKQQNVTAVDGIDLDVAAGEIFGLLGPNGAGKTTTISMCTTRVLPTSGSVHIAGVDMVASPAFGRRNIGVVTQYNTLDRSCTIFENLYFHCRYFGFPSAEARTRAEELLAQFHLSDKSKAFPRELSGGLAQRVQIARSIAHRPRVLFLDEPSAGLDPQSRIAMWEAVRELLREGITVLLTTHYMEEADSLCDRVAIIDHGKILVTGTPEKLKGSVGAQTVYSLDLNDQAGAASLAGQLRNLPQVQSVETADAGVRVYAQAGDGLIADIVQAAQKYGLRDMSVSEPSLETVFIRLTGRDLRE